MKTILVAAVIMASILPRAGGASPAQEAALEQLNQRNIFFGEVEFIESVERGDADIVRVFLLAGMNPNTKLEGRRYPIHIAAIRGYDRMAGYLLDAGVGIDSIDARGYTPLMLGSAMRHEKVVALCLDRGADPALINDLGTSPLFLAVQARSPQIVKMLLEARANPLLSREGGESPLTLAVKLGDKEILELLTKKGHGARIAAEKKRIDKERKDEETARLKREAKHNEKLQRLQEAALGKDKKE